MKRLERNFYDAPTLILAERLLGKIFVHCEGPGSITKGRIVETEAYLGEGDEACHAWRGMTERNRVMFEKPGQLYIYFSYGCHFMANVVSEPEGMAGAVLLRAMEPIEGIGLMQARRKTTEERSLMSGPGKLTQALGIGMALYGESLFGNICWIEEAPDIVPEMIGTTRRIGISRSTELPWRKFLKESPHVSRTRAGIPEKKGKKAVGK
ncbi:MAG: DNA-3-methyladenine glycosylase [Chlorobiaceae bacterium]|nr:DNA-3-methyladenine glycosylase [Chlorobiaceae bacterium]